jgi:hypothetical protein
MLKEWQFNVLFFVGVGGAILLLVGPELGLDIGAQPMTVSGIGAILTYVLTQKKSLTKTDEKKAGQHKKEEGDGAE